VIWLAAHKRVYRMSISNDTVVVPDSTEVHAIAPVKLPHAVIVRAPGLLPMLYTPVELERELTVPARTVREWVGRGLPHHRDERGYLWLDGRQVAAWVKAVSQPRPRQLLKEDEAYCFHCRQAVPLVNPIRQTRGKQLLLQGVCPQCQHRIYRGGRHG
jgi:hypothetical protein